MTFVEVVPPPHLDSAGSEEPSSPTSLATWQKHYLIGACALVASVMAALSGVEPTGTALWDPLLAGLMAGTFVLAAGRAHALAGTGAAACAVLCVGFTIWLPAAVLGLVLSVISYRTGNHLLRAVAGGCTIVALVHLSTFGIFGLSALVAGVAVAVVLVAGYRTLDRGSKAWIRRVITGIALFVGALTVFALYQVLSIRATAESGVSSARKGLEAARAGDTPELTRQLDRAELQLAEAADAANSLLLRPLKLVPVGAQHVRALTAATSQGVIVANQASSVLRDVNLDQLQLRQGQFDLDLLASMAPKLADASDQLGEAVRVIDAERSPWLLPPVTRQLEALVDEANDVLPETQLAAEAAQVVPGLLGSDGERRYLMLFGAPGESREFGGFVGGFALISVLDGGLDLVQAGSINELLDVAREDGFDDPDSYPDIFVQADPAFFPQNLTSSPSLDLIARATRDIFPEIAGAPVDGLIYADPYALAAMTDFTGPLTVQGVPEPLDRAGLVDFMFDRQYRIFASRDERFGAIGDLAQSTAQAFQDADLPGPERLGEVLGPMARAGRLQVVTYDDAENAFLASVLLQRDFAPKPDVDVIGVVQGNATASKLDLYIRRQITYDVTVRPDGSLSATVDVVLTSDIPADAPELAFGETDGTNQVLLSLYTDHDLVTATVNGSPHEWATHPEFGFQRHALFTVPLAPNTSATAQFVLRGRAPTDPYRMEIWSQPLVHPDLATVLFRLADQEAVVENRQLFENWLFAPLGASSES